MTMNPTLNPIKIIIADDHALVRAGLIVYLERDPGLKVVAEAGTGTALVSLTEVHKPDVVFTDIQMPEMDGIEATGLITKQWPGTAVIALTMFNEKYMVAGMLRAGARGYILKGSHTNELLKAIRAVSNNQPYYCPGATLEVNSLISSNEYNPVTGEVKMALTLRETTVLLLICDQKTNKEISEILGISIRTVEYFRSSLFLKTNVNNVAGLVAYAIKQGIYNP